VHGINFKVIKVHISEQFLPQSSSFEVKIDTENLQALVKSGRIEVRG
jgi:hypothetical protein